MDWLVCCSSNEARSWYLTHQVVKVWDIFTGRAVFEFKGEENAGDRSNLDPVDGISAVEIDKSGKRFAYLIECLRGSEREGGRDESRDALPEREWERGRDGSRDALLEKKWERGRDGSRDALLEKKWERVREGEEVGEREGSKGVLCCPPGW